MNTYLQASWILKPSAVNRGAGIRVFLVLEQLLEYISTDSDVREWIVSRYVDRPLLVGGRKFHIRAYVLAVGAIVTYFYDDVLCLCAGTKYDDGDLENSFAHITNTCYQAKDPGFNEEKVRKRAIVAKRRAGKTPLLLLTPI